MTDIDLDRLRRERTAETGEADGLTLTYRGQTFPLVADLPVLDVGDAIEAIEQAEGWASIGKIRDFLKLVFADDESFAVFLALKPGKDDLMEMIRAIPASYGFRNLGESSASSDSSRNTGSGSTPTSAGSTDSQPDAPSSVQTESASAPAGA